MNIYTEGNLHHKNAHGITLLEKEGINFPKDTSPDIAPDIVCMFDKVIDIRVIRNLENYEGPVIFGPHTFLFDRSGIHLSANPDSYVHRRLYSGLDVFDEDPYYFNALSPWNKKLQVNICGLPDVNVITLPFPVDIDRFQPKDKKGKPVIYFKHREPSVVIDVLDHLGEDFIIFNCGARYREETFLQAISTAPYCIWIGCHESQGFAFQETLSSNTPIFVINVKSLRDEVGSFWADENCVPGHDLAATSAAYFDEPCGLISYPEKWKDDFDLFLQQLNHYAPRDFVVTHLSPKVCKTLWEKYA